MSDSPIVVIGLGNDFRSDDSAGLMVARHIREKSIDSVKVVEGVNDTGTLFEAWQGAEKVIIVDAATSGMNPGRIYRFDALNENIPENFFGSYSTHNFSITDSVELAAALGELPDEVIIFGIEGKKYAYGTEISTEVKQAIPALTKRILHEITEPR